MTDRFRTVRISNPIFEKDHLRFMTVKSSYLKGRGDIAIFVPPNTDRKDLPIAILLHGVYGSAWSWSLNAGAHLTAMELISKGEIAPMILAMPSDGLWGDGSGYLPHHQLNFEKWIVEDVIDAVRLHIPEAENSTVTFIGGLSMGGYGALRLGAKYGDLFAAIAGHSAITALDQMSLFVEEDIEAYRQQDNSEERAYDMIINHRERLPPMRFDCGTEDLLISFNRTLHQQLVKTDIAHEYVEHPGKHEWAYWEEHLAESLLFFNCQLGNI
jgi:enterochelin esterase-like enzyme